MFHFDVFSDVFFMTFGFEVFLFFFLSLSFSKGKTNKTKQNKTNNV